MKTMLLVIAAVVFGAVAPQEAPVLVSPDDVKFVDGPPSLPPGVKSALIFGDPKAAGPFVLRIKFPANYKVPPHFHPDTETVTVLSGTFHASMGDTFDAAKAKAMATGSLFLMSNSLQALPSSPSSAVATNTSVQDCARFMAQNSWVRRA